MDGQFAYSSTGEIIDVASQKIVAALKDETGRDRCRARSCSSWRSLTARWFAAGNQFGVGMKK